MQCLLSSPDIIKLMQEGMANPPPHGAPISSDFCSQSQVVVDLVHCPEMACIPSKLCGQNPGWTWTWVTTWSGVDGGRVWFLLALPPPDGAQQRQQISTPSTTCAARLVVDNLPCLIITLCQNVTIIIFYFRRGRASAGAPVYVIGNWWGGAMP